MLDDLDKNFDAFIYLEQIQGTEALKWVAAENEATIQRLQNDPRFQPLTQQAETDDKDAQRIALPSFTLTGEIRNVWVDDIRPRGVWRKADRVSYFAGQPEWTEILDIDALAEAEGRNWVFSGVDCYPLNPNRCLISLSDGGKDAVEIREFDVKAKQFLEGGFKLSEAKQEVRWFDEDTLFVSREWSPGEVTEAGYPYVTKRVKRGHSFDDAVEVFRGEKTDVTAYVESMRDWEGKLVVQRNSRCLTFDACKHTFIFEDRAISLPLPEKSEMSGYFNGQLIYKLKEGWQSAAGTRFPADSVISFDFLEAMHAPMSIEPVIVFAPKSHQVVEGIETGKSRILLHVLSNVSSELYSLSFEDGQWIRSGLTLPDNIAASILSIDRKTDQAFLSVESFLEPIRLYWVDAATLELKLLQQEASKFDASKMQVRQNWVRSKDGIKIPYFIVSQKVLSLDGSNPTLINGYGGFGISLLPTYLGSFGKTWLEAGGVYVVANIRGGNEFGSQWHESARKTGRQHSYDDFQAVAEDLMARKITSPRRLGITGSSNGGLLTAVQLTQRPDLWNAVLIGVPLTDMMRYNKLLAGASWIGEYGDPSDVEEGAFLHSISPYHNLKPDVHYPEPFIITANDDDRVHPGHARKMAAKMQSMGLPVLFYESEDGGHSGTITSWKNTHVDILEKIYFMQKLMD